MAKTRANSARIIDTVLDEKQNRKGKNMELNLAQQRLQAHVLIDGLPEEKLLAVRNLLEVLADPGPDTFSRGFANAPVEEEELNAETMAALHRASASLDRGEGISHDELRREYGL